MGVYSISQDGIEALEELRVNIAQSINDILDCSDKLHNEIRGLGDDLGIYYRHITLYIEKILAILKKALEGEPGVGYLVNSIIPKMITNIEILLNGGLGDDGDPPKVLTLGRWK